MQSVPHCLCRGGAQLAGAFDQFGLIDREDLGHVYYAGLGEVCFTLLQKHVAGGVGSTQIRSDQTYYAGLNRAAIKNIVLHNHAGMPVSRCRTGAGPEVQPVHLSLADLAHQRSLAARGSLAFIPFSRRFSVGSTRSAYTSFNRCSICSRRCRWRKSPIASANRRLRLKPIRRAVLLACSNNSWSIEMAVFMSYYLSYQSSHRSSMSTRCRQIPVIRRLEPSPQGRCGGN